MESKHLVRRYINYYILSNRFRELYEQDGINRTRNLQNEVKAKILNYKPVGHISKCGDSQSFNCLHDGIYDKEIFRKCLAKRSSVDEVGHLHTQDQKHQETYLNIN
ncbi:10486_t:CDS:1 [Acaulospora morrowiae]|uniref:10486_t:CDS:1 n=1 Tax=Acaulospora morrowiae TaxID=94023 RepID=A0A9N9DP41_9GLOM|nr:10486_t:CDS:1 [Acaulospora morrowiae]